MTTALIQAATLETYSPLIVTLDSRGVISNDSLSELRDVLLRNATDDCELWDIDLLRQLLDLAQNELRSSHVYSACFANGEIVHFIGESRLPALALDTSSNTVV